MDMMMKTVRHIVTVQKVDDVRWLVQKSADEMASIKFRLELSGNRAQRSNFVFFGLKDTERVTWVEPEVFNTTAGTST